MIIYKVTNTINNKIYIGKTTKTLDKRFNNHLKESNNPKRKYKSLLYDAINKYGKDNFKIELVEDVSDVNDLKYLSFSESYWILYYRTNEREFGYNIKIDSEGGDTISNNPNRDIICKNISMGNSNQSKEIRKRKSAAAKNKPKQSIKTIEKRIKTIKERGSLKGEKNGMYDKHHKKETCEIISIKLKKRYKDPKEREKISIATKLAMQNLEIKKLQSEKAKKRFEDPKEREKMSKSKKGKKIKLTKKQQEEYSKRLKGENNPMYGKCAYNIWIEKYGIEEANKRQEEATRKRLETIKNKNKKL